jgi:hypothetical protein
MLPAGNEISEIGPGNSSDIRPVTVGQQANPFVHDQICYANAAHQSAG